ncbi:DNA-processing protein DprA [Pseudaestuariivita atlantica]|uniref:DNA processing protein DprA n=1 Tax=Pseudaestuariivita atlantica TaxID=1317121 RepID=A0A0L1JTS5_9RHOB|nr:DNA-processing protein DprA [Pseudaestuariivita atlantica]KNG94813.1 DNA processing protein DprA [Pseudaestuariivita atlantica]
MAEDTISSTPPPIPPTTEDDRLNWLRLLRSRRVGPTTFYRLMAEHGSAAASLDALPGIAANAGVTQYQPCPEGVVRAEARAARAAGARLLAYGEPDYPSDLAQLPDAPPLMWTVGDRALLHRPMVALVGARNASSLGTRMTRALAQGLTEAGFVVVSGLARGIDAVAHHAALDGGTIAVMPGGVDIRYPSENTTLAEDIARKGLLVSEQPMGLAPLARHFPKRNRIISGLARAVVVVEAAAKSGSLITARNALDQGRDVLAVPGHPFDARAGGCNLLIRDGATLIRTVDDVIEALAQPAAHPQAALALQDVPPPPTTAPERSLVDTARLHATILDRLGPTPLAEDQLLRDLDLAAPDVAPALTELEIQGDIERHPGGLLARRG